MVQVCNLLVDRTRRFLDSSTLFQIEVEEALDKVVSSMATLKMFKTTFKQYKKDCPGYFKHKRVLKKWNFKVCLKYPKNMFGFYHFAFNRKNLFLKDLTVLWKE